MRRADSLEKTLMLEKIEDRRRRGQQRMSSLDGVTDSMGMSLSKLWEMVRGKPGVLRAVPEVAKSRHDLATEQQRTVFSSTCP